MACFGIQPFILIWNNFKGVPNKEIIVKVTDINHEKNNRNQEKIHNIESIHHGQNKSNYDFFFPNPNSHCCHQWQIVTKNPGQSPTERIKSKRLQVARAFMF